ncbi:MAG: hypothetical protein PHO37_15875 [Kiritimatiellae bacterium]|nr:hypothetical protein [Kiritimatiellia bacterium]
MILLKSSGIDVKINLKDGHCVSCGRESGVLYRSCPYCGERVWHPLWRRVVRGYTLFMLPLLLTTAALINPASWSALWELCCNGALLWQGVLGVSLGLLLMPRHDKRLILTSSKEHLLWLLNSLAASVLLLLCAVVSARLLRLTTAPGAAEWLLVAACWISALLIPNTLNSGWWRVGLAGLILLALLLL